MPGKGIVMFRGIAVSVALAVAFLVLVGCKSARNASGEKDPAGPMKERAALIAANGGVVAVGIGRANTIAAAVYRARMRAQAVMAYNAGAAVKALRKDFQEEAGSGRGEECGALFDLAATHLGTDVLPEVLLAGMEIETKDAVTTAYALMELDPKVIASALENAGQANKSLYALFCTSKAAKRLGEETSKYREFKKEQGRK
jgi:hypothetical protein